MKLDPKELASQLANISADEAEHLKNEIQTRSVRDWIALNKPEHFPPPEHTELLLSIYERAEYEQIFVCLSIPPRYGKTTTLQEFIAYLINKYPARMNCYVTYNEKRALAKSLEIQDMVTGSGCRLDPRVMGAGEWRTSKHGGLIACGVDGGLVGEGFSGVRVLDDPYKNNIEAYSVNRRATVSKFFGTSFLTRTNKSLEGVRGSVILIHTRWLDNDLYGEIQADTEKDIQAGNSPIPWQFVNIPALRKEKEITLSNTPYTGEGCYALWSAGADSVTDLQRAKRRNPSEFSAIFQGVPVSEEGKRFKDPARYLSHPPDGGTLILSLDPAGSESTHADESALIAQFYFPQINRSKDDVELSKTYIIDREVFRLENDDAAKRVAAFVLKWAGSPLVYETTRDGVRIIKMLKQILVSEFGTFNRLKFIPVAAVGDKIIRSKGVSAAWNGGRVLCPVNAEWVDEFITNVKAFTGLDGEKDDDVDAMAHGWNYGETSIRTEQPKIVIVGNVNDRATGLAPRRNNHQRKIFGGSR